MSLFENFLWCVTVHFSQVAYKNAFSFFVQGALFHLITPVFERASGAAPIKLFIIYI